MARSTSGDLDGDGDCYYLARVGAEKAYRGMLRRCKEMPEGLRQAAGLAEQIQSGGKQFAKSYFRELRDFLGSSSRGKSVK